MKSVFYPVIILCMFVFSGCGKDKDVDPLVRGSWRISLFDFDPSSNPPGNVIYYPWQECQHDYRITFRENGELLVEAEGAECEDNTAEVFRPGKYVYRREGDLLVADGREFKIAELSGGKLKLYAEVPSATGFQGLVFLFTVY